MASKVTLAVPATGSTEGGTHTWEKTGCIQGLGRNPDLLTWAASPRSHLLEACPSPSIMGNKNSDSGFPRGRTGIPRGHIFTEKKSPPNACEKATLTKEVTSEETKLREQEDFNKYNKYLQEQCEIKFSLLFQWMAFLNALVLKD